MSKIQINKKDIGDFDDVDIATFLKKELQSKYDKISSGIGINAIYLFHNDKIIFRVRETKRNIILDLGYTSDDNNIVQYAVNLFKGFLK